MRKLRYWFLFCLGLIIILALGQPGYARSTPPVSAPTPPDRAAVAIAPDPSQEETPAVAAEYPACSTSLTDTIDRIIDDPIFVGSQWGIRVESLSSDTPLYSRHEDSFLIPASNIKLLTTAAALQSYTPASDSSAYSFAAWIDTVNRYSDNYDADRLLDWIGGLDVVREKLLPLGIDPSGYRQVDGSGLSRYNMATPMTFVKLLKAMRSAAGADLFYNSLPIAGLSGTLNYRFQGTLVQGKVHAKTGTLRGVKALSGYLERTEDSIVFSILVNQAGQSSETLMRAIDQVVLAVDQGAFCSPVGL